MSHLSSIISKFQGISLGEMDEVKLMNRTDKKYWFCQDMLTPILEDIAQDYFILEVSGERNLPYSTTYYDTESNEMFQNHHRGKLNRYKIRRRNYISTQSSFLEVKFKSNKGRTIKTRQTCDYNISGFSDSEREFIAKNTPYSCDKLRKVLENRFYRLMLVSRSMDERCTIDSSLSFSGEGGSSSLDNMVIVEVKRDGKSPSRIIDALNARRIKPSGFSKYCICRSYIDQGLKRNNFKGKLREIGRKTGN
ncbi:MAG: polyphosphate polymerase domain-containing protein [Rikenellaceae bacterium]